MREEGLRILLVLLHNKRKKSNAFSFSVGNIEKYLRNSLNNEYKSSCKIYAKISSTVYLYNVPKKQTVWTSVDLKQRQLFDLD